MLARLSVTLGLAVASAMLVIGVVTRLQLYGDGSIFSYAIGVQDAWAFHWHNISGRVAVYLLCHLPSEFVVALTGSPDAGIASYGLLFFAMPLVGLGLTRVLDRSAGRLIFVCACASTAALCPLMFGSPTEVWVTHALFWPTLTLALFGPLSTAGGVALCLATTIFVLTHPAALVLSATIFAMLVLRGWRDRRALRFAFAVALGLAATIVVRLVWQPDGYAATVLARAAYHFFDPETVLCALLVVLIVALSFYTGVGLALARWGARHPWWIAAAAAAAALVIYWFALDRSLLADHRYYLRTVVVIVSPLFAVLAIVLADNSPWPWQFARRLRIAVRWRFGQMGVSQFAAGALLLTVFVHGVETTKFVVAWQSYKAAVAALAGSGASDPVLGDPRFVSEARLGPVLNRVSWFSTTPYLSVVLAGWRPERLVVDPTEPNYYWLSCAVARRSETADRAAPRDVRSLLRVYSCLHRP